MSFKKIIFFNAIICSTFIFPAYDVLFLKSFQLVSIEPLLKKCGELSKLSFVDQVTLFHNADVIIGEHGTGLVNILFCKPGTKIIELFQARSDASFTYLAETIGLDYTAVKTMEFMDNNKGGSSSTSIPLEIIINIIKTLQN